MSGGEFTKGPWRVDPAYPGDIQTADGSVEIALTWASGRAQELKKASEQGAPEEQADANARLIAAAPDMYEALELLIADFADYPASERPCHAFDVARAALSRASSKEA